MSTIAAELDNFAAHPIQWVLDLLESAVTFAIAALSIGFVLYYAWPAFAGAFSFLHPLGGYWNCVLAALGFLAVRLLYDLFRGERGLSTDDETRSFAMGLAVIGMLAWLVVQFLA